MLILWLLGVIVSFIALINIVNDNMERKGTDEFRKLAYFCCFILSVMFSWFGLIFGLILMGISDVR